MKFQYMSPDLKGVILVFLEYLTDMSFILVALIGGIIALLFVYIKKRRT